MSVPSFLQLQQDRMMTREKLIVFSMFFLNMVLYIDRVGFAYILTSAVRTRNGSVNGFAIDEAGKGRVLSGFFWGYALSQVPGGILAKRSAYGPMMQLKLALPIWSADNSGSTGRSYSDNSGGNYSEGSNDILTLTTTTLQLIVLIRAIAGAIQGFVVPGIHGVMAQEIESSKLALQVTRAVSGLYLGALVASLFVSGFVVDLGASEVMKRMALLPLFALIILVGLDSFYPAPASSSYSKPGTRATTRMMDADHDEAQDLQQGCPENSVNSVIIGSCESDSRSSTGEHVMKEDKAINTAGSSTSSTADANLGKTPVIAVDAIDHSEELDIIPRPEAESAKASSQRVGLRVASNGIVPSLTALRETWAKFSKSKPLLAIVINSFTFHYAFYVLMNWMPTYFSDRLAIPPEQMGFFGKLLPYALMFIFSNVGGFVSDFIILVWIRGPRKDQESEPVASILLYLRGRLFNLADCEAADSIIRDSETGGDSTPYLNATLCFARVSGRAIFFEVREHFSEWFGSETWESFWVDSTPGNFGIFLGTWGQVDKFKLTSSSRLSPK